MAVTISPSRARVDRRTGGRHPRLQVGLAPEAACSGRARGAVGSGATAFSPRGGRPAGRGGSMGSGLWGTVAGRSSELPWTACGAGATGPAAPPLGGDIGTTGVGTTGAAMVGPGTPESLPDGALTGGGMTAGTAAATPHA